MTNPAYGALYEFKVAAAITDDFADNTASLRIRELAAGANPRPVSSQGVLLVVVFAGSGDADLEVRVDASKDEEVSWYYMPDFKYQVAGAISTTIRKRIVIPELASFDTHIRVRAKCVTPDGTPGTIAFHARLLNAAPFNF